jgi:hypothetical protein
MKTKTERKYPYIVARNKPGKLEYYVTIKPNRRIYLQSISKQKIAGKEQVNAYVDYVLKTTRLKRGDKQKPELAKIFYRSMFGAKRIVTKIR